MGATKLSGGSRTQHQSRKDIHRRSGRRRRAENRQHNSVSGRRMSSWSVTIHNCCLASKLSAISALVCGILLHPDDRDAQPEELSKEGLPETRQMTTELGDHPKGEASLGRTTPIEPPFPCTGDASPSSPVDRIPCAFLVRLGIHGPVLLLEALLLLGFFSFKRAVILSRERQQL